MPVDLAHTVFADTLGTAGATLAIGAAGAVLLMFALVRYVRVQHGTVVLVERFGRYMRTLGPGLHWLQPWAESVRRVHWTCMLENPHDRHGTPFRLIVDEGAVDMREISLDLVPFAMDTRDRLTVRVNTVIYFRIVDAQLAVYAIDNLLGALASTVETALRSSVCKLKLDEAIDGVEALRNAVTVAVTARQAAWGFELTRFELQSVDAPRAVTAANEHAVIAARNAEAELRALEAKHASRARTQRTDEELLLAECRAKAAARKIETETLLAEEEGRATRSRTRAAADAAALKLMRDAGATDELLARQLDAEAWRALCARPAGSTILVPYQAARFLGLGSALNAGPGAIAGASANANALLDEFARA